MLLYLIEMRQNVFVWFILKFLLRSFLLFVKDFFSVIFQRIVGCGIPRTKHFKITCSFSISIPLVFDSIVISTILGGARIQKKREWLIKSV
jgi:hypothetical protein